MRRWSWAGVADWSAHHFDPAHRSDPRAALAGAPTDAALRVLLGAPTAQCRCGRSAGFDLQLSGHTHGGQFLPWNFFVRLRSRSPPAFCTGCAGVGYVSRGTGYWGPPKRFGAPSEITRLRLVAA